MRERLTVEQAVEYISNDIPVYFFLDGQFEIIEYLYDLNSIIIMDDTIEFWSELIEK